MNTSAINIKKYYTSKEFEENYTYEGKLGAFLDEKGAHFLLWAPVATKVRIRFFADGDVSPVRNEEEMTCTDFGVW